MENGSATLVGTFWVRMIDATGLCHGLWQLFSRLDERLQAVERLQREVDASAAEIERLTQNGDTMLFKRLPPVARANTIHEELEALRKWVGHRPGQAALDDCSFQLAGLTAQLPPVLGGALQVAAA